MDLQDSPSQPVLAHQYLRYAEGLEKDVDDTEIEAVHPSVPPSGFVQRVRAMLESKAAAEAAANKDTDRARLAHQQVHVHQEVEQLIIDDEQEELHELAANESPRFTVIEEYDAPVELPASPVRIAELAASPVQPKRRITRDMVKAELGSTSADTSMQDDTASIDGMICHKASRSQATVTKANGSVDIKAEVVNEPSTPGAELKKADDSHSEPATESSPAMLGLSGLNYALRFDSTTGAEETHSKDPFVLDADTITLQQQRSKETVTRTESQHQTRKPDFPEPQAQTEIPVSPILAGEDVSRCSAVSPLQTQTLGIDETLRMASEAPEEQTSVRGDHAVPGAFPEEIPPPPPTPRTPKTYSKSVQIPATTASTETSSSNRYSLPPDLSTVGDTMMNTNSDMVTDVAVRFSLPQTTITVSRPQIIEIPPSSSPEREPLPILSPKPALHASDSKSKRGSVTFADEVASLKINKKLEQHPSNNKNTETRLTKGKSIIRRPSPLQESGEPSQLSRDSTTDLRFSGINAINNRFGSTHLPGLKEESVEEMSLSDKRATEGSGSFQFPLPARIAAVKAMQERRLQESAEKAKARRAARHPNRQLAEIRDLPSLNFSRMNLIDKLNEALEVRTSKSMEVIRRREFSGIYCPSPQRPMSTEPLRERYMSFFSKPEDFSSFLNEFIDMEDEDGTETTEPVIDPGVPTVEVQPNTEIESSIDEESGSRPLSPDDWLSVANQVNRLSIPSVSGLSERLSEILPNLRELQLDSILAGFGEMSDDVARLGDGIRPDTVLSTRSSAGFRTLAERAEEIVKNGTHDSTVPLGQLLTGNKALPGLPESMSTGKVSAVNSTDGKQSYLSGSVSAPSDLGNNVARPPSALTRTMAPLTEDEVRTLLPPEMNPITRNAKRAMIISTASSRPWNQDENYPWASTKVDVDLIVPSQAHVRDSTTNQTLGKRKTKSLELSSTGEPTNATKGIDIGSILEHDPTPEVTQEQLTGLSPIHLRKQSKRSVIGSITKKIGLGRIDCSTTRSIPSPTVTSDLSRNRSSQAHRAGERYPTSGLTPPAVLNLDEVRSFFSDNSSEKERNASFRKRLTHFKSKNKHVRLDSTGRHSLDGNTAYDAGEMNAERIGASSSANTYDGVGMGKAEFRIKRFGEKIRNLMAKGGELIRSWSQRSKVPRSERVRDDWLSDSLYSGV